MDKIITSKFVTIVDTKSNTIIENEVLFCELDLAAGDGDFGMSLSKGFKVFKEELEELPKADIGVFLKECGMLITEHCGGASGPIWGSAFRAAGIYALGL